MERLLLESPSRYEHCSLHIPNRHICSIRIKHWSVAVWNTFWKTIQSCYSPLYMLCFLLSPSFWPSTGPWLWVCDCIPQISFDLNRFLRSWAPNYVTHAFTVFLMKSMLRRLQFWAEEWQQLMVGMFCLALYPPDVFVFKSPQNCFSSHRVPDVCFQG